MCDSFGRQLFSVPFLQCRALSERHTLTFTAAAEHIDLLGHVNNAVWVQWMEAVAVAHWEAVASAEHQSTYLWVVSRHEIDYRGNINEGDSVEAETYVPDPPRLARFDRRVDFRNSAGKIIVSALTTWVLIDRVTGQVRRIPPDMSARFRPPGEQH
jgi:acyl-CoA thioester hydrolase